MCSSDLQMDADGSMPTATAGASGQSLFIGADAPKRHRPYLRSSAFICGSVFFLLAAACEHGDAAASALPRIDNPEPAGTWGDGSRDATMQLREAAMSGDRGMQDSRTTGSDFEEGLAPTDGAGSHHG